MISKLESKYQLCLDALRDDRLLLNNPDFRKIYWPILYEYIFESRKVRLGKSEVFVNICEWCQEPIINNFQPELHHGILTKADASRAKWEGMIDVEYNLFILHPSCHRPKPPSRERCWQLACKRHGEEVVKEWYLSIPYKTKKPPRIFWSE